MKTAEDNPIDVSFVDDLVARMGGKRAALIGLLQAVQAHCRYLPEAALERLCAITEITPADVTGVSTFYDQFRHRPAGDHTIKVCIGTACHVKGADQVYDAFREVLGIVQDEDTDPAGRFTIERVACLGCCTLAPAVQIGDVTYGHLTSETVAPTLHDFLSLQSAPGQRRRRRQIAETDAHRAEIRISMDTCCLARGAAEVYQALDHTVVEMGAPAVVKGVGCAGLSYMEPLVEVEVSGQAPVIYAGVQAADAPRIVERHFQPPGLLAKARLKASRMLEHLLTDEAWPPITRYSVDVRDPEVAAFAGRQVRIATEHAGQTRPTDLDEYLGHGGFSGLRRCLTELTGEQIIKQVRRAGLRGRGGAGYPTARKWTQVRSAAGDIKYVVCNGDEGDPGAFMDRMLLESHPYRVLEGIAIAATAVGAEEGHLYIRAEYPLAVRRVREAIDHCRQARLLGENIGGSSRRLELSVMEGAGAFVCGEETALLASIEGRRGMPRLRPPYPAERGLWGKPTLVNNVETYALVPWILRNGGDAFARMGTEHSKGTKAFALAGKIVRGGLIEVPMGVTIRQVVEEIGGGIADGKRFKAVQIGGPSGGCVPAELGDTRIDYEALAAAGTMMGSGGLVVLDEDDCMVDIARYFLEFTQDQSCGKCTPCRVGTRRMLEIMTGLCEGRGQAGDLEKIEQLAHRVKASSLCGLGKTAPNPILSTLKYFRDEYEAHLAGKCPAKRCKALITYSITDECIGCTICAQHCPADAIEMRPYAKHEIDATKCVRCDTCRKLCPTDAVNVE